MLILFALEPLIPYSGLFLWVEIFVKSWKRLPELNFVVLNFVARSIMDDVMWTLNLGHGSEFLFRQGKMGRFSVESCVRSYSSQTQVTSSRIKDFPCWGWLDRTCQTT